MKKVIVSLLISCMLSGIAYALDLESEANEFEWVLGNGENVLSTEETPLSSPSEQQDVLLVVGALENKTDAAVEKSTWGLDRARIREYKHGLAGALLGGYVGALVQDSYGLKGGAIFSLLASAAAIAVDYENIVSSDNQYLIDGFIFGLEVPLVARVLLKRR